MTRCDIGYLLLERAGIGTVGSAQWSTQTELARGRSLWTPQSRRDESQKFSMARPSRRSETGEVATKVIPVRLTESEHREIQTKKGDLSQSEYIRRAALDEAIPQQAQPPPCPP
jgi:hypothetical protein